MFNVYSGAVTLFISVYQTTRFFYRGRSINTVSVNSLQSAYQTVVLAFHYVLSDCAVLRVLDVVILWGISGKVSWLPLLKSIMFLPNTAQYDTPSIPSQNNCSLGDESRPQVFFAQAFHYHWLITDINT